MDLRWDQSRAKLISIRETERVKPNGPGRDSMFIHSMCPMSAINTRGLGTASECKCMLGRKSSFCPKIGAAVQGHESPSLGCLGPRTRPDHDAGLIGVGRTQWQCPCLKPESGLQWEKPNGPPLVRSPTPQLPLIDIELSDRTVETGNGSWHDVKQ